MDWKTENRLRAAALSGLAVLAAIGGSAPPKPSPNPPAPGFAGKWITSWGKITLAQIGNKVGGTYYNIDTDEAKGRIDGTVTGNVFNFERRNLPNGNPRKGSVKLSMTGHGFYGRWETGSSPKYLDWGGVRNPSFPGSGTGGPFAGKWRTTFGGTTYGNQSHQQLTLYQEGNQVMGKFTGEKTTGRGFIDGVASGKTVRFTWVNIDKHGAGSGRMTLEADGKHFKGTINGGGDPNAEGGFWNASKL